MSILNEWPWLRELHTMTHGEQPRFGGYALVPSNDLRRFHKEKGGHCFHCGSLTLLTRVRCDRQATRDHLIPRSKGGGDGANLVLSCYRCNQDKGDKMLERA